jgi:hypothetical protein
MSPSSCNTHGLYPYDQLKEVNVVTKGHQYDCYIIIPHVTQSGGCVGYIKALLFDVRHAVHT